MVSMIIVGIVLCLAIIPLMFSLEDDNHKHWIWWLSLNILWIICIFTGVSIVNNEGQYKGYITAIEKNGSIFIGYNAYLKTDLTSSNEDTACVDRNNKELIEKLKKAQENKENITVKYEGVWQYKIGECPNASWKIIEIINNK